MDEHLRKSGLYDIVKKELRFRNYGNETIKAYLSSLRSFAEYFHPCHPRELKETDIRSYLLHLQERKKQSPATVNEVFGALRFLYAELYQAPFKIDRIPRPKKIKRLSKPLDTSGVAALLQAVRVRKTRA